MMLLAQFAPIPLILWLVSSIANRRLRLLGDVILAAALLVQGLWWYSVYRDRRYGEIAATLPEGLFVRARKRKPRMIPWERLAWATMNHLSVDLRFKDGTFESICVCRSPAQVDRFVFRVNLRIARVQSIEANSDRLPAESGRSNAR